MLSPAALVLPKEGRGQRGFCVLGFHLCDLQGHRLSFSWLLYFSLPCLQFFSVIEGGFGDEHQAHHTSVQSGEHQLGHWGALSLVTWVLICFQIQPTVPSRYEHKELMVTCCHTCQGLNLLVFSLWFLCLCL